MKAHGKQAKLGGMLLAVALATAAILALPAVGLGKHGSEGKGPRPAGTVSFFDSATGELTVALGGGGTISALVVRRTQIRCGRGRHHLRGGKHRRWHGATASRRGAAEPGDNRRGNDRGGNAEDEVGDDRGRRGLEPGDGHGNHGVAGEDHRGGRSHPDGRCNAGDLVEGAVVMRAEIVLTHGKALYKKIGLLPAQFSESEPPGSEE
jgi:hypothetical protein